MTHGQCCIPSKPTPRVAGTAPLTAAMAAWTSSFDLLPPRAPAPAEQLFAAGWSAHFVSSIKIMAGKMKSRSGPIWPLTPKPTWAQLAALTFSNLAVWSARSLRRGGRRAPDVSAFQSHARKHRRRNQCRLSQAVTLNRPKTVTSRGACHVPSYDRHRWTLPSFTGRPALRKLMPTRGALLGRDCRVDWIGCG